MEVSAYDDYLTEADLRLIARAVGASAAAVAELAGDAAAIEGLLADPRVFSAVFGTVSPASPAPPAVTGSSVTRLLISSPEDRCLSQRYTCPKQRWKT